MFAAKRTSRFVYLTVTLLLLLSFFVSITAYETGDGNGDGEDEFEGIEELIALDEEEESQQNQGSHVKSTEAEVIVKAQRIVLELNSDNTKKIIDGNEYVLVLGYAPWCPRSAELMPQFAEAATSLKELGSPLLMSKLDAERHPKTASSLGISGFPTLLLFTNGTSQPYTGGFSSEEIVIWVKKKTGVPVIRINSVTEAEEFLKKHHMFAIGLFKKFVGHEYEEFVKAATSHNEIQFVEVNDIEVAKVLFPNIKPNSLFLGLVKSEMERYTTYEGTFEMDQILDFLDYNKFPLVTILTELNSIKVYSSPVKFQVFVFAKADAFKNLLKLLQDVARKFVSKIMIVYVDITEDNLAKPFLTLFGLEDSEDTIVTAFDNKISSKYLLESDPTPSKIEEFCSGLLQGTLSPHFRSQAIPDNKEESVQIVVGKTFDNLVLSGDKNVLLEVYSPWCIDCETTSKQMKKLAKHFKGLDNLIFARIDASANEHPKLKVDDYPTLLFYKADDKSNPIKLSTKSSSKDLAAFINQNIGVQDQVSKDEL